MLIRWSLTEGLRDAGFDVLEAGDGAAARRHFAHRPFLVFQDFKLPDTTGLDLLRYYKATLPACAVVLMTALEPRDRLAEAQAAGLHSVVRKPFQRWVLGRLPAERGQPVEILEDQEFNDLAAAEWTVFKLRWKAHTGRDLDEDL